MTRHEADSALIDVYCRTDGYFILTMDRSTAGLWMASGAVTVVPPDASGDDLAAAAWKTLAPTAQVVAHPSQAQWPAWRREKLAPILRAAKVRSWAAFETGASKASVDRHGHQITITPCRVLAHPRGSREEMTEHQVTIEDPSHLSAALRHALALAECLPETNK